MRAAGSATGGAGGTRGSVTRWCRAVRRHRLVWRRNMTELEAFVRLSTTLTGLSEGDLPAAVEQRDAPGVDTKTYFDQPPSCAALMPSLDSAIWKL